MITVNSNLPDLKAEKQVTDSQIKQFQKNGHILIAGILNAAEVSAYRDAINQAAQKYNTEKRKLNERG